MRSTKYKLTIDNPCSQDWNSMTPNSEGRFCFNCSKSVIDLSNLSDNELAKFVEQNPGKFCGRMKETQLNRTIVQAGKSSNHSFAYKVLAGALLLGSTENSTAQISIGKVALITSVNGETSKNGVFVKDTDDETNEDSSKFVISGVVLDSIGNEPVPFATVMIQDSKIGVVTDIDGKFRLVVPDSMMFDQIKLQVTSVGYIPISLTISKDDLLLKKEIILNQNKNQMGELVVVGGISSYKEQKKWWQFWK